MKHWQSEPGCGDLCVPRRVNVSVCTVAPAVCDTVAEGVADAFGGKFISSTLMGIVTVLENDDDAVMNTSATKDCVPAP